MSVEQALRSHLAKRDAPFRILDHPPCRTSDQSAAARAEAGAPDAVGAKALVVITKAGCAMLVIPGMRRLDSKRARSVLGKFRFARPDEVCEATGGLEIGTIPPFGKPVLGGIDRLIVDVRIAQGTEVGFNAASLTRSIIMSATAYVAAAQPHSVEEISLEAKADEREEPAVAT